MKHYNLFIHQFAQLTKNINKKRMDIINQCNQNHANTITRNPTPNSVRMELTEIDDENIILDDNHSASLWLHRIAWDYRWDWRISTHLIDAINVCTNKPSLIFAVKEDRQDKYYVKELGKILIREPFEVTIKNTLDDYIVVDDEVLGVIKIPLDKTRKERYLERKKQQRLERERTKSWITTPIYNKPEIDEDVKRLLDSI